MALLIYKWCLLTVFSFGINNDVERRVTAPHPFYVSVTEVSQNSSEKTLEVSCKFFWDDFEHTIEKASGVQLDITAAKDKSSFDKHIPGYINKHLILSTDGKAAKLNYIGYEKEAESVYCYFEVTDISSVKNLSVNNSLLYDFTKEQINIMHITVNGKRQSSKLSYPEVKAAYRF